MSIYSPLGGGGGNKLGHPINPCHDVHQTPLTTSSTQAKNHLLTKRNPHAIIPEPMHAVKPPYTCSSNHNAHLQAQPTTMHKPSYAHAALGLSSFCTNEDTHPLPCLDSQYLKPVGTHDGKPSIRFKKADKQQYLDLMKHVLVGKFSPGRPTISIIKKFFIALKLKGAYNISLYDAKHLIIECELLEDYTHLWVHLTWFIKSYPMRIFKWTADFNSSKEYALTLVWAHFPGLPIYLYEEDGLLSIPNSIGKPLRIDSLNTNRVKLGVASVYIELDVSKPLVDKVSVSFEDDEYPNYNEGFCLRVDYDEIPHYCSKCFHMGHSVANCKRDFEKERMQEAKGKMELGTKPAYARRHNYRRVYNPKAAQPIPIPKPTDCIASSLIPIPEKKDDLEKFPKPALPRGGAVQKWMEKHYRNKTTVEEVVTTNNPFAKLSVVQGDTQPERDETVSVRDPKDKMLS
ncbi:hypothetical protein LIER_39537 [Lithospermum erythrorhizon]|uniref:DUF4283 domain-containing protein n=1 Tax=Lithospermum erythrorhizon TaxID=34254 RepID=A0AAV3QGG3_LITER